MQRAIYLHQNQQSVLRLHSPGDMMAQLAGSLAVCSGIGEMYVP
jgi:hypothetical protein